MKPCYVNEHTKEIRERKGQGKKCNSRREETKIIATGCQAPTLVVLRKSITASVHRSSAKSVEVDVAGPPLLSLLTLVASFTETLLVFPKLEEGVVAAPLPHHQHLPSLRQCKYGAVGSWAGGSVLLGPSCV